MEVTRNPENGKFRFVSMTEGEYLVIKDDSGLCLGCAQVQSPLEPDAAGITCEACAEASLYGVEELLQRGRIRITAKPRPKKQGARKPNPATTGYPLREETHFLAPRSRPRV